MSRRSQQQAPKIREERRRRPPRWIILSCTTRKLSILLSIILSLYVVLLWSAIGANTNHHHVRGPLFGAGVSGHGVNTMMEDGAVITIGIASTITACGSDKFTEGAAVLKYSIDLTSIHGPKGGKYDYKMYILHHPDALECSLPLVDLGFELLERPTPINVSDIKGDVLRERIVNNGCCGEKELIKLEAFRLTQHPVVIHLDLDVLVMQPMDPAIDLMLHPKQQASQNKEQLESFLMWPDKPIPEEISLMFTKDYNVVAPRRPDKPFQGGFFMIKPSLDTYNEFIRIVREGDYRDDRKGRGWGGKVGPFHGGMTIQGLLPWYYEYLHPNQAVELNRCVYNNMADNPTTDEAIQDVAQGRCRTNQEECEDCRNRKISDIVTFHYTICFKPWTCSPHGRDIIEMRLCRRAHHEWFLYRRDLEISWGRNGTGNASFMREYFLGHCSHANSRGYQPIHTPYGQP